MVLPLKASSRALTRSISCSARRKARLARAKASASFVANALDSRTFAFRNSRHARPVSAASGARRGPGGRPTFRRNVSLQSRSVPYALSNAYHRSSFPIHAISFRDSSGGRGCAGRSSTPAVPPQLTHAIAAIRIAARVAGPTPRHYSPTLTRVISRQRTLLVGAAIAFAVVLATAAAAPGRAPRPSIVAKPIPYGPERRAQMAACAKRHYGLATWRLRPRVVVQHYTASSSFSSAWATFAANAADPELHELPGVCAHFVINGRGRIFQLVGLPTRCRHVVGLNHLSVGIEHTGYSDGEVMGNARQLRASLRLTRWLRCRYAIAQGDVIGHNESLSSPHHREKVARLRTQTHGDMAAATMRVYRAKLRRLGGRG